MGIWNTKDYKGQPVTWYSAEEIEKYKQVLKEIQKLVLIHCKNCKINATYICEKCLHESILRQTQKIEHEERANNG